MTGAKTSKAAETTAFLLAFAGLGTFLRGVELNIVGYGVSGVCLLFLALVATHIAYKPSESPMTTTVPLPSPVPIEARQECVDCRDYEENIRGWIKQLGGNPDGKHISLELERLIDALGKKGEG